MVHASMIITNRCNLKCKMCDIGQNNRTGTISTNWSSESVMSPGEWGSLLDNINATTLHIKGIEPLLYPNMDMLLRRIYKKNRRIYLTTNGWFIKKWYATLNQHVDIIYVSLDGRRETHDKIRGVPGSYDKAHEGIELLKSYKKDVRISFAITPENVWDMKNVYDMAIPVIFNHYNYIIDDSCNGYDPTKMDIDLLYKLIKYCKNAKFDPHLTTKRQLKEYYRRPPQTRKTGKCKPIPGMVNDNVYFIASDGSFRMPTRCHYRCDPANKKRLKRILVDIDNHGLPIECQRLCCSRLEI